MMNYEYHLHPCVMKMFVRPPMVGCSKDHLRYEGTGLAQKLHFYNEC